MKTAFAVDFLLERTPETFLLELLLAGEEDADIYCLAHAPGRLQGVVETHRIIASPLSRLVRAPADLPRKAWLIPSAVRQLQVAPDVDRLVVVSNGWAHAIASGPRTERHVWINRWQDPATRLTGLKRFFGLHHEEVKRRALKHEKHVAFSSRSLASAVGTDGAPVIAPGFKTDEFPLVPEEQHPGEYPHHLVLLAGAMPAEVRALIRAARERNVPLKMLGPDQAYAAEKASADPLCEFIGDHCEATTAAFTHAARAVWVMGESAFPAAALGAWCCGRPVIARDSRVNREFLAGAGAYFLGGASAVAALFEAVERDYRSFDRKLLRRQGLKWNERLFKSQMRAWAGLKTPSSPPG